MKVRPVKNWVRVQTLNDQKRLLLFINADDAKLVAMAFLNKIKSHFKNLIRVNEINLTSLLTQLISIIGVNAVIRYLIAHIQRVYWWKF